MEVDPSRPNPQLFPRRKTPAQQPGRSLRSALASSSSARVSLSFAAIKIEVPELSRASNGSQKRLSAHF